MPLSNPIFRKISRIAGEQGVRAFVVGGYVRDHYLRRPSTDIDVVVVGSGIALAEALGRELHAKVSVFKTFGTAMLRAGGIEVEFVGARKESYTHDSRKPQVEAGTLEDDQRRRDFTINAMAYNEQDGLVDLFHGMEDLKKGVIRCVGNAEARFSEDALRILRAIRFSAQLGFEIEKETRQAIRKLAPNLSYISAERIQTELVKLLVSDHPDYLRTAWETGLTREFLPEFDACMETEQNTPHHCYTVGEHILKSLTEIENDRLLRITMLLHDIAKPVVKKTDENGRDHFKTHGPAGEKLAGKILRRLKFDNVTIRNTCRLIRYHDLRPTPDAEDVRRAVNLIGEELFPLYLKVQKADLLSQSTYRREEKLARLSGVTEAYQGILERGECTSLKTLAVSGKDLIKAGHPAGPALGALLERLLDCVLKDPTLNTKEKLLETAEKDSIKTE